MVVSARWQRALPLALAALAGATLLAGPDALSLAATSWLALLLYCEALARAPSRPLATTCGLVFGASANAIALGSLGPLLQAYAHLPPVHAWSLAALTWLLQGVPYALAAWLGSSLQRRAWPRWLALCCSTVAALAVCPQLFPWHIAATQVGFLSFAQIAELGGESLLGACLLSAVGALHGCLRARGSARGALVAIAATALLAPTLYGWTRLPEVGQARALAPKLRVGVVQANAPLPDTDEDQREVQAREALAVLQTLTVPLERDGAQLTVWGETAYPYPLLRSARHAPRDVRAPLARGVRGPLLMGVETHAGPFDGSNRYNSAWWVHEDGRLGDRIDKARLIPFGEYVPLWSVVPALRRFFHAPGFRPGVPGVVNGPQGKLGVLICYEDLFASAARDGVRSGARALLNLTNDVWFGPSRTAFLHDLLARLRTIEQRRDLVRAVNTGHSSFTLATGEQVVHSEPFTQASFLAEVALLDGRTPYSLLGDLCAPGCSLLIMLALVRRPGRQPETRARQPEARARQPETRDRTAS